jgi:hypothetical protein
MMDNYLDTLMMVLDDENEDMECWNVDNFDMDSVLERIFSSFIFFCTVLIFRFIDFMDHLLKNFVNIDLNHLILLFFSWSLFNLSSITFAMWGILLDFSSNFEFLSSYESFIYIYCDIPHSSIQLLIRANWFDSLFTF